MTCILKLLGIFLILISFPSFSQDKIEVTGLIKSFRTSEHLESEIVLVQGADTIRTQSDSSGKFAVKIIPDISSEIIVRSDGYLAESMEFTPKAGKDTFVIIELIYVRKRSKAGERLKGVLFEIKSAVLKDTLALINLAKSLRRDYECSLIITGLVLTKESNCEFLAQKRAEAVRNYLIIKGLSKDQIKIYTGVLLETDAQSDVKTEVIGADLEVFP